MELNPNESIAFIGDLHVDSVGPASRLDDYMITVCEKVNDIRIKCLERNVKAVLFSGDIFNRIQMPNETINMIGIEFKKFIKEGISLYSIVGNHDIARNRFREEKLLVSPLSILFNFDIVKHINLTRRIVINKKTLITPVDYTQYPPKAMEKVQGNILFAHMFFNAGDIMADENHNLKPEHIKDLGYDCAVLGHDHVYYPIMNCEGTDIVRPGSVMRATAHEYNFRRIPCFYVLRNPEEYNVSNFEQVDIVCKPFVNIASNTVLNKKSINTISIACDLSDLASKLADNTVGYEDRIVELIKSDTNLPNDVRQLIFNYFQEMQVF